MNHQEHCDGCSVDAAGYPLCRPVEEIQADVAARRKAADARLGGPLRWKTFSPGDPDPGEAEVQDRQYRRWRGSKGIWRPVTGFEVVMTWQELLRSEYAPLTGQIRIPEGQ